MVVHIFTYSGDAHILGENVLCLKMALPEADVVIVDDAHNPCPIDIKEDLISIGVEWRQSSWKRNGNLRGPEAILGIVHEMLMSAKRDNDILLKVDSDTLILDGKALREFACSNKVLWGSFSKICAMHGCAYAVRAGALRKVYEVLRKKDIPAHAPEDCTIAEAFLCLYSEEKHLLDLSHPFNREHSHSIWAGYNWREFPRVDSYLRFSVVVTGNRPVPPLTYANRSDVMKALREAKQKQLITR